MHQLALARLDIVRPNGIIISPEQCYSRQNPNDEEARSQLDGLLENAPHLYAIAEVK